MEYIKLRNSEIEVSQICFGGEQLGGFDLGDYNIEETISTASIAIENGINFFDTADCYGMGESEKNLGRLIKSFRSQVIVGSKFGVRIEKHNGQKRVWYDNSHDWTECALHDSLKRIRTDYIDLYQIHYWDKITPLESIFNQLQRYCDEGKIRYYGVTNVNCENIDLSEFPNLCSFSFEKSLAMREMEDEIATHLSKGLNFIAYGALGQGILTGKYDSTTKFNENDRRRFKKYKNFHGHKLGYNLEIIELMKDIANMYQDVSVAQVALKWVLTKYHDAVVIAGIKTEKQLADNLNIFNWTIEESEMNELSNFIEINDEK